MNDQMKNNVLITGITGFLGQAFATYFSQQGWHVIGLTRSQYKQSGYKIYNTDYAPSQISKIIKEEKPKVVIHTAGSSSVNESVAYPAKDFKSSVQLFHQLLEGVRISDEKPYVVYTSSASVYGNPAHLPIKETDVLQPISPYGYHNLLCELLAQEYTVCYSIPSLVVRLFSVFGSGQKKLLLWELFNQFQNSAEITIEGTGDELRDYIYIEDLARLLFAMIQKISAAYTVMNLASGQAYSVQDIVKEIEKIMQSQKPIHFIGKHREGHPDKWQADISLYESLVGKIDIPDISKRLRSVLDKWAE